MPYFPGGIMKKFLLCTLIALTASLCVFAGDVAVFTDIGFSDDGQTYIFGQYGKKDKTYQAWADIFTVNVAKNEYVKNEVFSTTPSKETANLTGKTAFDLLAKKAEWKTAKYNCKPASGATLLYVRSDETKKPTDEIVFKDFESSTEEKEVYYHIKLVPTYTGSGKKVSSKYYINLEKQDGDGNVLFQKKVGTPDFQRKGISSYKITRIFSDKSGKSIVFIIEKTLEDETGTSIRYMVETVRF
jgi:predicted secreted protein